MVRNEDLSVLGGPGMMLFPRSVGGFRMLSQGHTKAVVVKQGASCRKADSDHCNTLHWINDTLKAAFDHLQDEDQVFFISKKFPGLEISSCFR